MAFGDGLSVNQLITMRDRIADTCVRVMDMPEEVREANSSKGGASPVQAGQVSAFFAVMLDEAIDRRLTEG